MNKICYGLRSLDSSDFVNIDGYVVDKLIAPDLFRLKKSLESFGVNLQIESAYRPFERQLSIWNRKASGELPLLNASGDLMERPLDEESLMYAILTWSALPGASRHHLGTDIDVVDGLACPKDYEVKLTPAECSGMFKKFHDVLSNLIDENKSFGFNRVFIKDRGKIQPEMWHIAHIETSKKYLKEFLLKDLKSIYEKSEIACKSALLDNLESLAENYIYPYFI